MKGYRIFSIRFTELFTAVIVLLILPYRAASQTGRYWDQSLNSEAALLSGIVVAGEGGIAAIYYNPATISQMTRNSLSLSANLFSTYFFKAQNAIGDALPADRVQFDVYPRIITLIVNPKKRPDLTVELAYFTKTNEYIQINEGVSMNGDIIPSNPGPENYTADYYLRSKMQDYYGGAGFGYKVTDQLRLGFSALISYKDDQYYNLITANAFTGPADNEASQYVSGSAFHEKHNMYDVRLVPKLGIHLKKDSWAFGANINLPSVKIFGNGTVVKQYEYSGIHKSSSDPAPSSLFWGGRQKDCPAHFRDPFSIAAGTNFYSPSGRSILLFTAEYFFGIRQYDYIGASGNPGEEGYNFTPFEPDEWLSTSSVQKPVLNAGVAFKRHVNDQLMISGGFRTDFNSISESKEPPLPGFNMKNGYKLNVYHLNSGIGYNFRQGSIILGMQFSYGQKNNRRQVINLSDPVEYISEDVMPLTGHLNDNVTLRYFDVSVYFGFLFNFMKAE